MKILYSIVILILFFHYLNAQERIVKVDFESGSFENNPKIPFDEPFVIIGEVGRDIEFVKVNISYERKKIIFSILLHGIVVKVIILKLLILLFHLF